MTNKKNTKLKLTLVMDGESETVDSRRATDVSLNRSEEKREKNEDKVLFCFLMMSADEQEIYLSIEEEKKMIT